MPDTNKPDTVDAYLAALPPDVRAALEQLRRAIRQAAPEATETISYQVPTFRHHGSLVGFGGSARYCSFYVMSPSLVTRLKDDLAPYDVRGATIRFSAEAPLPATLVEMLVAARIEENEQRK